MFQCVSITKLKPEKVDEVIAATKKLADMTRKEEGNISYQMLQPVDDPNTLVLIENWENPENFQAHGADIGKEGSPLNEYSKLVDACCEEPSTILPCAVIY